MFYEHSDKSETLHKQQCNGQKKTSFPEIKNSCIILAAIYHQHNMTKIYTTETETVNEKYLPFKAVIFDMDGTLIESTEADYLAWKMLFADYDHELSFEDYFPLLGMKSTMVVQSRLALSDKQTTIALAQKMKYFEDVVKNAGINTVPFAIQFL